MPKLLDKYHKINSPFKRKGKQKALVIGDFATPEIEFLAPCQWIWAEKVDGTNTRIIWDGENVEIRGRTDNANWHPDVLSVLQEIFTPELIAEKWGAKPVVFFGETYGHKIQGNIGKAYIPDGHDFVLFDVMTFDAKTGDGIFLHKKAMEGVAKGMGIKSAPIVMQGTLDEAIEFVRNGFDSVFGTGDTPVKAEGLIGVPVIDLKTRRGERIIVKVKAKDFQNL